MATVLFGVLVLNEIQDSLAVGVIFAALFTGMFVATLVYFGLLAQVIAFFVNAAIGDGVLTLDMSKMYATTGVWMMLAIAGLAVYGFYVSRAGKPLFGTLLPEG